jgi:hypothetical protein
MSCAAVTHTRRAAGRTGLPPPDVLRSGHPHEAGRRTQGTRTLGRPAQPPPAREQPQDARHPHTRTSCAAATRTRGTAGTQGTRTPGRPAPRPPAPGAPQDAGHPHPGRPAQRPPARGGLQDAPDHSERRGDGSGAAAGGEAGGQGVQRPLGPSVAAERDRSAVTSKASRRPSAVRSSPASALTPFSVPVLARTTPAAGTAGPVR